MTIVIDNKEYFLYADSMAKDDLVEFLYTHDFLFVLSKSIIIVKDTEEKKHEEILAYLYENELISLEYFSYD